MNLTARAEQALLGALLSDPAQSTVLNVASSDFSSAGHGGLYQILRRLAVTIAPAELIRQGVAGEYGDATVTGLQRECPDPRHVGTYARMVMEAALRRRLNQHADRMQTEAANLHYDVRRLEHASSELPARTVEFRDTRQRPAGLALREVPGHQLKLSMALRTHLSFFDPGRESQPVEPDPAPGSRARAEEQILALIIQRHEDVRSITGWLPPGAFTGGPRREMYDAIVSLHGRGEPVDELTADWERAGLSSAETRGGAPDTSYGARLAHRPVDVLAALHASHVLFRSYLKTAVGAGHHVRAEVPAPASSMLLLLRPSPAGLKPDPGPRP